VRLSDTGYGNTLDPFPEKVPMLRAASWRVLALGLLPWWGALGCVTFATSADPPDGKPDPLLAAILRQEVAKGQPLVTMQDVVLREVPLQTPLAEARSIMEGHGFSCWSGVPDGSRTCLHCTGYKRKRRDLADKVVVKLFYADRMVVHVEVTVEHDVSHPDHGFWHIFSSPKSPASSS
jgi:hypothetical protein